MSSRPVPRIQQWDVPRPASAQTQQTDRPWDMQGAARGEIQPADGQWDGQGVARGEPQPVDPGAPLLIDCATCSVRGTACGDCVVTVLLGGPPDGVELADDERQALDVLAGAGLIPPLRAAPPSAGGPSGH